MKTKRLTRLEHTAYHEAGHAVASLALRYGQKPKKATIVPDEEKGYLGAVHYWRGKGYDPESASLRTTARLQDDIASSLAGWEAEKMATGRYDNRGAICDHESAAKLAGILCGAGETATAYLKWARVRTRNVLHNHWEAVERMAKALLEHQTLTRKQMDKEFLGEKLWRSKLELQTSLKFKKPELPTLPPALSKRAVHYCESSLILINKHKTELNIDNLFKVASTLDLTSKNSDNLDTGEYQWPGIDKTFTALHILCLCNVISLQAKAFQHFINIEHEFLKAKKRHKKTKKV